jgi:hypothetical protein
MIRDNLWLVSVIGVALASFSNLALGQVTGLSPGQGAGGYASRDLGQIYRQGVGTGYSGGSLNQIALNNARARVPNVGQASATGSGGRLGLGVGGSSPVKPFSNYSPAPTVSPYMNLFREDLDGNSDFNYQTLVRPLLQQQQFNQQLQKQTLDNAQRLQQISAQADFKPQGNENQAPTGHQTVFQYHGHFYPGLNQRGQR